MKRKPSLDLDLDRDELRIVMQETGYDEDTVLAWFSLFSKYSNKKVYMEAGEFKKLCDKFHGCYSDSILDYIVREGVVRFRDLVALQAMSVAGAGTREERLRTLYWRCEGEGGGDGRVAGQQLARWGGHFVGDGYTEQQFVESCQSFTLR